MSDHKLTISGRRESLPLSIDETYWHNGLKELKATISDLFNQFVNATNPDAISSLKFDITQYRKREAFVEKALADIQKHRDYMDDQYFQYIAGINENEATIHAVAQYKSIDVRELSRNSRLFLEVMHHTRLYKIADRIFGDPKKDEHEEDENEALKRELDEAIEKLKEMEFEYRDKFEQMCSEHADQLRERDDELNKLQRDASSDAKKQQSFVIKQVIEIWKQQQADIQQDKPLYAHAEYGLLLATAVQKMDDDYNQERPIILERGEHTLRTYVQELIQAGNRDYTSPECKQAIIECNRYLRGMHPRQAELDSVFRNPESLSLEKKVLAFDAEGEQWWWLQYLYGLLKSDQPHEIAQAIHRIIRKSIDNQWIPDFSEFLEYYQFHEELQEAVQSAYNNIIDKKKRSL